MGARGAAWAWVAAVAVVLTTLAGPVTAEATEQATTSSHMQRAHSGHTMTVLKDGRVLVVGGTDDEGEVRSAELFDPATGVWSYTSQVDGYYSDHAAVLLPSGQVLVVGEISELYDPAANTWTPAAQPAGRGPLVLLPSGKVLVVGSASAQLYDPAAGTWSPTGAPLDPLTNRSATLLGNGKVLLVGGASAELYDPATGTWTRTGSLPRARTGHEAVPLVGGTKVLVVGGIANTTGNERFGDLYDVASGTWSATGPMTVPRNFGLTASPLGGGKVLVTGGQDSNGQAWTTAEVYDRKTNTWTQSPDGWASTFSAAAPLSDGRVLVSGGFRSTVDTTTSLATLFSGTPPAPSADLSVDVGEPTSTNGGQFLRYFITPANAGPTSSGGTVRIDLSSAAVLTAEARNGSCTPTSATTAVVQCTFPAIDRARPAPRIELKVATHPGVGLFTAKVSGPAPDPDPSDNSDRSFTLSRPDVSVAAGGGPFVGGGTFSETGTNQVVPLAVPRGSTGTATIRVRTLDNSTSTFYVRGTAGSRAVPAAYADGAGDITAQVVQGQYQTGIMNLSTVRDYTLSVSPPASAAVGATRLFKVEVYTESWYGLVRRDVVRVAVEVTS